MKYLITIGLILLSSFVNAQSYMDSKIIITLPDSANAYSKVKNALVRNDFVVKDLDIRDTLFTYVREYNNLYTVALATIQGNKITLSGFYNLKKVDDFGYNRSDNNRKRVVYTKGSKTWALLMKVAGTIGGEISYSK